VPLAPIAGRFPVVLTVDVEEWFHNCFVPEYVEPGRRPALAHELDRTLPELLALLAELDARATLFVLGEVAARHPQRIREAARAGHEIACHGDLHLRANDRTPEAFARDIAAAKARLEDLVGLSVEGFRSPEWSLRTAANPRFRRVAEAGFRYDSSLAPSIGAGAAANPRGPVHFRFDDGLTLLELPPLVWAGPLRLPGGGWCGRAALPSWIRGALDRQLRSGGAPVLVVHPWELVESPAPGVLTGFARFFFEAARHGYRERFREIVAGLSLRPLAEAARQAAALAPAAPDPLTAAGFARAPAPSS
jgi:peptidoglycan/xylan/chitin deacetylase (PgdA/CDA1 family)